MTPLQFTFDFLKDEYRQILKHDYKVLTCREFAECKIHGFSSRVLVNRVDIDFSVKKAEKLVDIFNDLGIRATFFIRLHAPEYNPFAFENYRIIKKIVDTGHEIGYHSEVVDAAKIWSEEPEEVLIRDIDVLNKMFKTRVVGVASHGGITGFNNLDFWKGRRASDYGLLYEAYDTEASFNLFNESFYVSDSEWVRWKCYRNGKLVPGDHRLPSQHAADLHPVYYMLIHPDTYYYRHIYE
jgi:peptidoglycan/xylan/chitin deacetylase (PgdA/CDA1 family)